MRSEIGRRVQLRLTPEITFAYDDSIERGARLLRLSRKSTARRMAIDGAGKIIEAVKSARSVFITTHVVPDGDAIGSLLGMKLALERLGKQCEAGLSDPVPPVATLLAWI